MVVSLYPYVAIHIKVLAHHSPIFPVKTLFCSFHKIPFMQNAVAFADNDVITIAWSYQTEPVGCMGFAIYRIDNKNVETALPSHAVFPGQKIKPGQTTLDFPVQKFYWKDVYARLVAEQTRNRKFRYKIVPMKGTSGHLIPMTEIPMMISNEVEISPVIDGNISAYFNRGLISTQRVSRAFDGKPSKNKLLLRVANAKDPLRASLAGDMDEALTGFLDRAKTSGKIHAALYELHDEQLIKKLEGLKNRLWIVLSNSAKSEDDDTKEPVIGKDGKSKQPQKKVDDNQGARDRLKKTTTHKYDRIMPNNHIGHNKFLVYVDAKNKPRAVLFGSTNWTSTGLCTQTNNTMVIEDNSLAARYLDYWNQLAKDTTAAKGDPKKLQAMALRTWDAKGKTIAVNNTKGLDSWFSPNTPKARSSSKKAEKIPPDMADVVDCIKHAKHAILFLVFYPGTPSIANFTAEALRADKNLFVRGCVTNKSASGAFYYTLKGITPPKKKKGSKTPIKQDPRVFGAEALDGKDIPEGWQKEILNAGFAIIHDKIVVIDPFDDDCVVITGSHNLGYKASFDNDENLAIIKGNKKLAMAYTTHVLDVYDHFSWRYQVKLHKKTDPHLKTTPAAWLQNYFNDKGEIKVAQLKFWLNAKGV